MFEVFDVDKVVFCYGQTIYVASITQGQLLGALCEHSDASGTVFVDQQQEEEEEKQTKNMDNSSRFSNNSEEDESQNCRKQNETQKYHSS